MVAEMHFAEQRYEMAYKWQEKHSRILLTKVNKKKQNRYYCYWLIRIIY
jgi:hypothetical protein